MKWIPENKFIPQAQFRPSKIKQKPKLFDQVNLIVTYYALSVN